MAARRWGSTVIQMIAEVTLGDGQKTEGAIERTSSALHWL